MAATKFSVIRKHKETNEVLIINYQGDWTYKTALAIAKETYNKPEDKWELLCVIETSKLYPNKNEKTKKNNKMDSIKQNI